jgi:ERF superfamily.
MKSNLKMKLANIQVNLKAKKSRYNGFGKYNYRAAEDILEAIKPFLDNEKVSVTITEEMISFDPPVLKSTASIHDAESDDAIHTCAIVGVDLMSKGMSMPQKYGAASSYGKKYALGNLLLIDDTADADASNDHSGKTAKVTLTSKKDPLFAKAIKFVSEGGAVSAIAGKYDLSKEIKKALEDAQPLTTQTL